ncbi:hypothetical protein OIDMADRAFT_18553 [Oidiodendron maius Zn]|uniref:Uncharacterized protein n=1 Tax=Oidiodendron maius (strain Zn) TaxID=913774 RepID=A0A0C3CW94_OIDMZ|nr:hypothetical protein OIDMADRAFT_18553 [Oidiodendron maius Zn]
MAIFHWRIFQSPQALMTIILLNLLASLESLFRDAYHEATFKHEGHTAFSHFDWLQVFVTGFIEGSTVRSVRAHYVM